MESVSVQKSFAAALLVLTCVSGFAGERAALPSSLIKKRIPQIFAGNCSVPLPGKSSASQKLEVEGITLRLGPKTALFVEGRDAARSPWQVSLSNDPGGCEAWTADLDRNGYRDLILVTFDPRSDGKDVKLTIILIDRQQRPVPWQAWGYFEIDDQGVSELLDIDNDGRSELAYLHVEGDKFDGERSSLSLYAARDAHWGRVSGSLAGVRFPILEPRGTKLSEQPELTNAVDPKGSQFRITSLIPGKAENCGVQLPITREPDGAVRVDVGAAEARSQSCFDKLTLSDGRKLNIPEIVVLDRASGRQVALTDSGDHVALLAEAKAHQLAVQVVGHSCESGCRPFLLWASDKPR